MARQFRDEGLLRALPRQGPGRARGAHPPRPRARRGHRDQEGLTPEYRACRPCWPAYEVLAARSLVSSAAAPASTTAACRARRLVRPRLPRRHLRPSAPGRRLCRTNASRAASRWTWRATRKAGGKANRKRTSRRSESVGLAAPAAACALLSGCATLQRTGMPRRRLVRPWRARRAHSRPAAADRPDRLPVPEIRRAGARAGLHEWLVRRRPAARRAPDRRGGVEARLNRSGSGERVDFVLAIAQLRKDRPAVRAQCQHRSSRARSRKG